MSGAQERRSSAASSGQTLFEFVRYWARRQKIVDADAPAARNARFVLAVEAVQSLGEHSQVSVNALARELAVDQSNASRLVKEAISAGYLEVMMSTVDTRRKAVSVTPEGLRLLADAHRWQEAMFDQLTAQWSAAERQEFHRAMLRLLESSRSN